MIFLDVISVLRTMYAHSVGLDSLSPVIQLFAHPPAILVIATLAKMPQSVYNVIMGMFSTVIKIVF